MRGVHWCVTVDYQQIENGNIANQIHGFKKDYGKFILESHNWIKFCILIGLRSEVFSAELQVENEARWYCFASTSSISSISG